MRPDMTNAFDEFDNMVEALEEQEDMVECKECFDLFPKVDCTKADLGYICPVCKRAATAPAKVDIDSRAITTDLYDQEFPEFADYAPGVARDYESEGTVSDALALLIQDEYEAIDGYEVADETIQHAKLDPEVKDDLLDTLDHIKEEEEEHIDELKDFMDTEEDSDDDDDEEDSESLSEATVTKKCADTLCSVMNGNSQVFTGTEEECEDWLEKHKSASTTTPGRFKIVKGATVSAIKEGLNLIPSIASRFTKSQLASLTPEEIEILQQPHKNREAVQAIIDKYNSEDKEFEKFHETAEPQTWAGYTLNGGEFVGACKAFSEDEAYDILEREYVRAWVPMGYEPDELYVELATEEDLDETDYLTEAEVGKIKSGIDKASNWLTGAKRKFTKAKVNLEEIFTSGFYLDLGVKGKYKDAKGNDLHGSQVDTLKEGEIAAKNAAKLAKTQVTLCANTEDVTIEDPNITKLLEKHKTGDGEGWKLVTYSATGSVIRSYIEEVNKALQKIELANQNLDGVADGKKKTFLADILKDKKDELGPMKGKEGYTKESYAEYLKAYGGVMKELEAIKDKTALAEYDVEAKREEIEGLLVASSGLEDTDDLETLRAQALEIIGDKKEADGYTPQSYSTYSTNYDKAVNLVTKASGEAQLKALIRDLPAYMEKLNAILKAVATDTTDEDPEDKDEDIPEEESVEDLKKAALSAMGEKKAADEYTEESYAAYSKKFDTAINYINKQTTVEGLKKYDFAKLRAKYEELLEKKPAEEEDIPEEPEEDTVNMEELKAKAKEDLGPKKDAEPYTEESYAEYSKRYDNIIQEIESAETEEDLPNIEEARAHAEEALQEKPEEEESEEESEEENPEEDEAALKKLKDELADKILDQAASAEDKEKYTEESCNAYDEAIMALVEELDPIDTLEALIEFEETVDSRIEELRKKLTPKPEDAEEDSDTTEEEDTEEAEEVVGKLKYTNKGKPREALGDIDSPAYKSWGFPEKVAYNNVVQKEWKNLVGILKKLVVGSGAKHTGDLQRLADTLGKFLDNNSSRFIFEAFKRKLIRECTSSEKQRKLLTEQLSKISRESLTEDFDEETVECTWCHDTFDKSACRYEVDLEWLCSRCEEAIKSRGETLTFRENNYWDFLDEDLKDTSAAMSELQNTQAALKSAADGIKNMTSAMKE